MGSPSVFCPNSACPASGQVGQGNIIWEDEVEEGSVNLVKWRISIRPRVRITATRMSMLLVGEDVRLDVDV
jgi:hypothetical protein